MWPSADPPDPRQPDAPVVPLTRGFDVVPVDVRDTLGRLTRPGRARAAPLTRSAAAA